MLGYFEIGTTGYIQGVPVCASYCDAWFEACRNDFTCVDNWLEDFDFALDGVNSCPGPGNSTCVTFEQMYGNGTGLCNRMWGEAFFYSTDADNCTVMAFNNTMSNPNYRLSFPRSEGQPTAISTSRADQPTVMRLGPAIVAILLISLLLTVL